MYHIDNPCQTLLVSMQASRMLYICASCATRGHNVMSATWRNSESRAESSPVPELSACTAPRLYFLTQS